MSLCRLLVLALPGAFLASGALHAQADISPPKAREKLIADAARVAGERNSPIPLPSPLPNPFVLAETVAPVESAPVSVAAATPNLAGAELLAVLAARIPSTGTVTIGGDPILLLGQKRLKVGDSLTISFEGQTYDLSIAAVTSTSFTVKRGENIHTRPIRITAASTNTPTNRP